MVYSTAAQVRAIVDTDMLDAEITELIEETDAFMDLMLPIASLGVHVLRRISRTWTAIMCMLKDPNSQALGEYREDRTYALQKLNEELERMMRVAGGGYSFVYDYAEMRRSAG